MSNFYTGGFNAESPYFFASAGHMLHELHKKSPRLVFTSGLNMETRRYCIFVYDKVERGTSIPAGKELVAIETEGGSEEAWNLLCTKLALIHG